MARIVNRRFWMHFGALLVIALLPVLLFAMLTTRDTADLKEIAQRSAGELDRLIGLREQQVFTIAAFPSIRAFTASTPATRSQRAAVALNELQAWVASDTMVREAFIVDQTGIVIMTTLEGWDSDLSARQFVQDALAGQLAVSPVAQDRGEFSNYYAAPVFNNQKEIAGALVIRVDAQEFWNVTPHGVRFYALISDENGARLDDTGDPARRLKTLAPLDPTLTAHIVQTQLYGAQLLQLGATRLERAQQLLTGGALDQLSGSDFNADAIATQRLVSKPWTMIVLAPQPAFSNIVGDLVFPLVAAAVLAFIGAFGLTRG
jgi:C4-dicarboxylate-specific signal transduction histidine kinase